MSDLVFWWTGWAAWAAIAVAVAGVLVLATAAGAVRFYRCAIRWTSMRYFAKHDINAAKLRQAGMVAKRHLKKHPVTDDAILDFVVELKREYESQEGA